VTVTQTDPFAIETRNSGPTGPRSWLAAPLQLAVILSGLLLACGENNPPGPPIQPPPPSEVRHATPDEVEAILRAVAGDELEPARNAVKSIVAKGDQRFASVLIELMRASQLQILHADGRTAYARALEAITGQMNGEDWRSWVEWYDATDLEPPPGFMRWKGELLGRLDPAFDEFLREGAESTVRIEEIVWGGIAFDGIPALDHPKFLDARDAHYLEPDEPVFGIEINGDARAYPQRILDWHEMANDVVGGTPISLAYCTLCGSAMAYEGRVGDGDGTVYEFGSSGLLMRSNKLMYDRTTRSLWNQFTGRPVVGPLAERNIRLERVPIVVARWKDWKAEHPATRVLDIATGHERDYSQGAAYAGYFATPELMFPVRQRSTLLAPKARVFGMEINGIPKAYSLDRLAEARVTNDKVAMTNVVLIATRGVITVEGRSIRTGPATYRAGGEVRAYDRGARQFAPGPDPRTVLDTDGQAWRVREDALVGPGGERIPRIAGSLAYWFGWNAFHPETQLYQGR
jgi:hypothetical protein